MAYTEADLAAVRTALLRGERSVQFADRSVTYRSVEELQAVEAAILRELSQAARTRSKQTLLVGSTGF
jgi:hypothetical protein